MAEALTQEGLKKKYQELLEAHEQVKATLALYQQRCADLDVERQTYLASHANLVRAQTPVPVIPNIIQRDPQTFVIAMLCIGMVVLAMVVFIMSLVK